MNVQELIDSGTHKWCPGCKGAVILIAAQHCRQCALQPEKCRPPALTTARPKAVPAKIPTGRTYIKPEALVDLNRFQDRTLWIVAAGKPITQGSMKAVAAGVMKHSKSKELHEWRNNLTKEALLTTEGRWQSLNLPVLLDVVLTVEKPKYVPAWSPLESDDGIPRIPPMVPPDVDKLLRAVQDALSPRDDKKKYEEHKTRDRRFKLLTDDSRIIDSTARKTYEEPYHTHPWALPFPGAVIRVAPIGQDIAPLPHSTLSLPDAFPSQAMPFLEQLRARKRL